MKIIIGIFLLSASIFSPAAEIPLEEKQCIYPAGIARETQNIRQSTHDSFKEFEKTVSEMYKNDQGLRDLLAISYGVYKYYPEDKPSEEVFKEVYNNCKVVNSKEAI